MLSWLITWLGSEDLAGAKGQTPGREGPIADFLKTATVDRVLLLHDRSPEASGFAAWLAINRRVRAEVVGVEFPRPDDFVDVHDRTLQVFDEVSKRHESFREGRKTYLLSPGSKAMSTALLWIGCTAYRGEIHANWADPEQPDPARRTIRMRWAEAIGNEAAGGAAPAPEGAPTAPAATAAPPPAAAAPAALADQQGAGDEALVDAEGRELTTLASVRDVYERAAMVARSEAPVLLVGETGTGKEIVAAWIHRHSPRAGKPFVPVKCGAIPPALVDSQVFGYVRGAIPGTAAESPGLVGAASGGTLYLDEVDALPAESQARLWRMLQAREVYRVGATAAQPADVRIIASTNHDLRRLVRQEDFRADLYFRIAQYTLHLPPLRERREDLPLLCETLLARWQARYGVTASLDAGAARDLRTYGWPGNVRELQGILTRCLVDARPELDGARVIDRALVARAIEEQGLGAGEPTVAVGDDWVAPVVQQLLASGQPYGEAMLAVEAAVVGRVINASKSQAEAARRLGMTPQGLNAKLKTLRRHGARI